MSFFEGASVDALALSFDWSSLDAGAESSFFEAAPDAFSLDAGAAALSATPSTSAFESVATSLSTAASPPNAAADATTCCAGSALAGACSCTETVLVVSWASTALDCWSAAESANETAGVPKPKRVIDSITASALRLNDHSCLAWRVAATFGFPLVMISPVLYHESKNQSINTQPH